LSPAPRPSASGSSPSASSASSSCCRPWSSWSEFSEPGPGSQGARKSVRGAGAGVAQRDLEPDGLAVGRRPRPPPAGQLVHQVQAAATLVVLAGRAQPGQPQVRVEHLDPDCALTSPQPQGELLATARAVVLLIVENREQPAGP